MALFQYLGWDKYNEQFLSMKLQHRDFPTPLAGDKNFQVLSILPDAQPGGYHHFGRCLRQGKSGAFSEGGFLPIQARR
jgi:hypothetical protein